MMKPMQVPIQIKWTKTDLTHSIHSNKPKSCGLGWVGFYKFMVEFNLKIKPEPLWPGVGSYN